MLTTNPEVLSYDNNSWFEEGIHFDSINENDCIDKIKYYLNNPKKREAIANAFHEKWLETCGPKAFWEKIFKWSNDK